MTVPMASKENVIVAEGLDEFFSLGYYAGWDGLDQIVYQLDYALACYPGPNEDMSKEQMAFLGLIRNEFGTKHIPLTKKRLDELEKHYFSKLDVGGLDEWEAQF